jgi:hypothetical protein
LACTASAADVDEKKLDAAGIRKASGKHLTLYTDLSGEEIDELPKVFDLAFPQWCRYFGIDPKQTADWRMTAYLMKDRAKFANAGLLPNDLPAFEHGFSRANELWLKEQPSPYYRRHLLLHEGIHGFMFSMLGDCGPLWYMEGMAEYLATHQWHDGKLTLGYMPKSREESAMWGRIRLIQDAVAERRAKRFPAILDLTGGVHRENELYAWCWLAAAFLDQHPKYQARFRELPKIVTRTDFNEQFRKRFEADWPALCEEWQLLTTNLEYGYDIARSAIDFTPANNSPRPQAGEGPGVRAEGSQKTDGSLPDSNAPALSIAADRGWQNTGLRLEAGVTYRIRATGRYQLAQLPKTQWCEPNGVSIYYYRGRPLGILLAAVHPDPATPNELSALLKPTVVGLETTLTPTTTGTLFLKINDSSANFAKNSGKAEVDVVRVESKR